MVTRHLRFLLSLPSGSTVGHVIPPHHAEALGNTHDQLGIVPAVHVVQRQLKDLPALKMFLLPYLHCPPYLHRRTLACSAVFFCPGVQWGGA